jgi:very-short-patch-repair endonuclease
MADKSNATNPYNFAPNVVDFICRATDAYANHQAEVFCFSILDEKKSNKYSSPIEDLFFISVELQKEVFFLKKNLSIKREFVIGNYRVDFLLTYESEGIQNNIIVELDGHDFHERNKSERSYEKSRDRDLIKSGYKVIHFTGSDVCADPHQVVFEALSMLGVPIYQNVTLDEIDPNNKLFRPNWGRL